jgi:sugar/nucleoside kinase (ribokinase family)
MMSNVWVLGSAAWDVVYEVQRMPAPGQRVHAKPLGRRAGGSTANVARALSSAGHEVRLLTRVGADDLGAALLSELADWGVVTDAVMRLDRCTPETLIFRDADAEPTIFIVGDDTCTKPVPVPYDRLVDADAVFVGRYDDFDPELPSFLRRHVPLVVSAVPPELTVEWHADVVVGSVSEYPPAWLAAPHEVLRRLIGDPLSWVIITRGSLGATAHGSRGAVRIPAFDAPVIDTTGAGDCFTAGLLHGLLGGEELTGAGRLGAFWAAETVTLPQSVPARWDELGLGPAFGDWAAALAGASG